MRFRLIALVSVRVSTHDDLDARHDGEVQGLTSKRCALQHRYIGSGDGVGVGSAEVPDGRNRIVDMAIAEVEHHHALGLPGPCAGEYDDERWRPGCRDGGKPCLG